MTRWLRIFAASTYRLSRRHPTVILIASFISLVTLILHLYAYRSQDFLSSQPRIGDFEYRPGTFLFGKQPGNMTYCNFNYGLPEKLAWGTFVVYTSPQLGLKGPYRVIYNAVTASAFTNLTKHNAVTYATQATPEFLYHVVEIAKYWEGPISVSVYVPSFDLDIAMQILVQLCSCYNEMSKVSIHLFYPKRLPPKISEKQETPTPIPTQATQNISIEQILKRRQENYRRLDNKTRAEYIRQVRQSKAERMMMKVQSNKTYVPTIRFPDCSGPENSDIQTYRKQSNIIYPINVGRNIARNASRTNYFIVSDIEMVPSIGLASKFLTMIRNLMGAEKREEGCIFSKTIFVVPLFEVERGEVIPHDKESLVRLVEANRASYFHQKSCAHCQRFPGLQSWLTRKPTKGVEPMLIGKREYPFHRWEPLYFGTQKEPWYSELLSWEGKQDKMTQMLELCLQDYRMVVLDGGYLCHAAVTHSAVHHSRAVRMNAKQYASIISSLRRKYKENPRCKLT